MSKQNNRLIKEKSPYLQQHGQNPVNWFPWGDEAFSEAEKRDVPVFLSIGYSTCHWCHVMAHESFEDEEVAEILNRSFVAVKVDREERPDIDSVYMSVCQAFTGSGGWPLTVLMTADRKPFFAGTYFPKTGKYGAMGLMELLEFVEKDWRHQRGRLIAESEKLTGFIKRQQAKEKAGSLTPMQAISQGKAYFAETFDEIWGGFGAMPKFPSPHNLLFLMAQKDASCMAMAEKTLIQMYRGGIFDHIGGGFCRYSTDERWLVPHFEKMLYDNALLLLAYGEGYKKTGKSLYKVTADRIAAYIKKELTHEDGGFFCGQDADSDGVEGKYYVFAPGEIKAILGETEGTAFCRRFDITSGGNFEGKSIPNRIGDTAYEEEEKQDHLERIRQMRKKRTHLHRDEKILTSWNGLMIAALARTGRIGRQKDYMQMAAKAEAFLWSHLHCGNGKLYARWSGGESAYNGTLEDYAFFAWALLECYRTFFDITYLQKASLVGDVMLEQFFDEERGGCFLYGKDSEQLFVRPKEFYDGAVPSGNSAAALVMEKLAFFTGDPKWHRAYELQKDYFLKTIEHGAGHSFMLWVLTGELQDKGKLICVAGDDSWIDEIKDFEGEVLVKHGKNREAAECLAPFLKEYPVPASGTDYYLCNNRGCQRPVKSAKELE